MNEIFELTKEQEKAITNLKRAMTNCKKANIGFFNVLDTTYAFDKSMIIEMAIDDSFEVSCADYGYPQTAFSTLGGNSWADDQIEHRIKLTKKGNKIFNNDL